MSSLTSSIADLQQNRRQWEAFTSEGHCVVLAPPGSGKTKLLTTRMAFDLANRIPRPQGAACITLTNAAADELRRRVDSLGVEGRPNLFIGTVHSFVIRRIIEPFARAVGRPELTTLTIASEREAKALLNQIVDETFGRRDARLVASTIEVARQRLAGEAEWARYGAPVRATALRYEQELARRGLHDFPGIVATAVELVERHKVVRQVLMAQYPHLYVDEYQDLAPGLDRVVKALCFDHVHGSELFAVGDPDQALFAFTGTRPELLQELAVRPDVRAVELEHNYRCGAEIIEVANRMRRGRPPITGDRPGGHVSATCCPSGLPGQYSQLVAAVTAASQRGVPLHEIAVLCPTRVLCSEVTAVLRAAGIPAFFRDTDYRLTTVTGFVEAAASWATLGQERSDYRLGDLLRRWRSLLGRTWAKADATALVEVLLEYQDRADLQVPVFIEELRAQGLNRALGQLAWIAEAPELARMSASSAGLTVRALAARVRKHDRVSVTTMTSSKGLEFDVVLVVGADERSIPSYQSNTAEKIAEDRRKFYVSITRAREEVRVYYSGFVMRGQERVFAGPSRFLREVALV
jgi:DNA helicase-2/ATP-dependent DNA helicase PcrA